MRAMVASEITMASAPSSGVPIGQLLIDGEFRDSANSGTFEVRNPATGQVLSRAALGTIDDARAAVEAAERAFPAWAAMPASERGEILVRAGQLVLAHVEEIARIVTLEEGKALAEARGEVRQAYATIMYFAGEGRRLTSNVVPSDQRDKLTFSLRRPLGVAAIITPWNFPSMIPMWNICPALVSGNAVVHKPASYTPLTAFRFAQLFAEAGIPKGVFNFVTGPGGKIGDALAQHPDVDVLAFTGETMTGRHLAEINARFLRRQVLELGGKNPMIVAADAPLEATVTSALWSAFSNAGQKCTAASRIIVEAPVLEKFTEAFVAATRKLRVGNGLAPGTEVGPLVDASGLEKVQKYVQYGLDEGAQLLTGGHRLTDEGRAAGHFHEPTIFSGTNAMRIAQDEIFGPVTVLIPADDLDHAVTLANDVRYGLASAIYTKDVRSALRAVERMEAAVTFVNHGPVGIEVQAPFGGTKDSGFGRELGEAGIEDYTEKKTVYLDYSYAKQPWYYPWA